MLDLPVICEESRRKREEGRNGRGERERQDEIRETRLGGGMMNHRKWWNYARSPNPA